MVFPKQKLMSMRYDHVESRTETRVFIGGNTVMPVPVVADVCSHAEMHSVTALKDIAFPEIEGRLSFAGDHVSLISSPRDNLSAFPFCPRMPRDSFSRIWVQPTQIYFVRSAGS